MDLYDICVYINKRVKFSIATPYFELRTLIFLIRHI